MKKDNEQFTRFPDPQNPRLELEQVQRQKTEASGGKREVYDGLQPHPGYYSATERKNISRRVMREIHLTGSAIEVFIGLADSGKSTVVSQRAAELEQKIIALNEKQPETPVRMRYVGWGPYLLSIVGDPKAFGSINHRLGEFTDRFNTQLETLAQVPNTVLLVEVPGVAGRGDKAVYNLVRKGAHVTGLYADESMRHEKMEFRRMLHELDPYDMERFQHLLDAFKINPNHPITPELLAKMRRMGATVAGIRAVDKDVDRKMTRLLVRGQIDVYKGTQLGKKYSKDEWGGVLQNHTQRTTAVGDYLEHHMRYVLRVPRKRGCVLLNDEVGKDTEKNLRQDVIDNISVTYKNGEILIP